MDNLLLTLNVILMISLPLLVGLAIHRRLGIGWRMFFIGGVTFIISQIAHIPFNYAVYSTLNPFMNSLPGSSRVVFTAVVAGLSAGLFEEGARYLSFRYWARDARTWSQSLMLGAGHGGVESILLGILAGLNVAILIGYQYGLFSEIVATIGEQDIIQAIDTIDIVPWYITLFGALERIFAICLQISFSVLVLQAVTRAKWFWLLIAISLHALIDAVSVWSISNWGVEMTELIVGIFAIIGLALILKFRRPDSVEPEPAPEPVPIIERDEPIKLQLTSEKLDDSRYSG